MGVPPPFDPYGKPTKKGNLASMHLEGVPFETMWENSIKGRRRSLDLTEDGDDDDGRARARVTFAIPLELARSLGCVP